MLQNRIIPVLLLKDRGLVKTVKFSNPTYVGDPINAVKIFNDKEVDELVFLDITATAENREPNYELIKRIAVECFMPFCYGGGVRTFDQARQIIELGAEKISFNTALHEAPAVVEETAQRLGCSSVVAAVDVKRGVFGGTTAYVRSGTKNTKLKAVEFCRQCESMGAGEILLNSVDRDGTQSGYDLELIQSVTEAVSIPVIACGGAANVSDFASAIQGAGAAAAAAGSLFVFYGKHRAVLINYPKPHELSEIRNF